MSTSEDEVVMPLPEPAEAESAEAATQLLPEEPQQPKPVERVLPEVSLDVYLISSGRKAYKTAGFRYWANSSKIHAATMPEWERMWVEFQQRVVR